MKNLERKDEAKKSQDERYSKSRFSTFNKNYSSDIQFIVPWVQLDEYGLEYHKNLLESKKILKI